MKINLGKASLVMTIIGGIATLLGGVAGTMDAHQTAVETARETTVEYLDACTTEAEEPSKED